MKNKMIKTIKEHKEELIKITISCILLVLGFVLSNEKYISLAIYITALFIAGIEMFIEFIKNLFKGELFDENGLMIIASVASFVLGNYFEGVLILLLFSVGELFEDIAVDNSKEKIVGLKELRVEKCSVIIGDKIAVKNPDEVETGSIIQVNKGESIAIDGVLISDGAILDLKSITGESQPYTKLKGDEVFSGSVNLGETILIRTTKKSSDSLIEKIIATVQDGDVNKSKSQSFISGFAKIYTPVIVVLGLLIAVLPPLFDNYDWSKWIYKSLSFIVVSCPCALVISVPLAFFVGIGTMAKKGVLVKGSSFIEKACKINCIAFDKTGTLTKGNIKTEDIEVFDKSREKEIFSIIYGLEKSSDHPISKSVIEYLKDKEKDFNLRIENVKEIIGKGMQGEYGGKELFIGRNGNDGNESDDNVVFLFEDGKAVAKIRIFDEIKQDAREVVGTLKERNGIKTVILSGDSSKTVETVGKQINVDESYSKLLPLDKANKIEEMKNKRFNVMFVGDGVNDAPSITKADVGVAMGGLGSDIAIEKADVVILNDELKKVPFIINKSKQVMKRVYLNVIGSILVKIAILTLGVVIKLPVWVSVFADVGVMILAVLNSITIPRN